METHQKNNGTWKSYGSKKRSQITYILSPEFTETRMYQTMIEGIQNGLMVQFYEPRTQEKVLEIPESALSLSDSVKELEAFVRTHKIGGTQNGK
ncbi:MAG: hypothetical protein Q8R18_04980 [bacterium]|nr:hypothetical protein [bacterium]